MNKKLLLGLFAAVGMLFATSCSQDEPTADSAVRFSLKAPAATTPFGDGTGANYLVYEVYDKDGNELTTLSSEKDAFAGGLTETVTLQLTQGQTYTIAFWAQNKECGAYDYSDLKDIKVIDYAIVVANNEARDAFFGAVEVTVTGDFTETVELRRPFAQLNFAVPATEWDAAAAAGITLAQSSVTVSDVAAGFNALTGSVTGTSSAATFALAALPTSDILIDVDADGTEETYKHLSMNYILANDVTEGGNKSALADVEFTFTTNGDDIVIPSPATPLQRNWRTNIIGSLTNTAEFTVVLDPDFEGDKNNYTVEKIGTDLSDAVDAATDTDIDEIVFTDDVNGAAEANSGYGKAGIQHTNGATIDGNGQTLTVTGANSTWDCAISTQGGTIKNLNIVGGFRGIFVGKQNSKVIIDNCTITPGAYTVSVDAGNGDGLEVKNSTLNGWTSYAGTIGFATFDNCHFGSNGSYAFCRPYAPTTFTNCTFAEGYEFDAARTEIKFVNCKLGDTLITAENIKTLFHADSVGLDKIVIVND